MKKILTISEPDCGGKPTGYAVEITNENRDTLAAEIRKGLQKGWYLIEKMAEDAVTEDVMDSLKSQGYAYIGERFLVEVTILDEDETKKKSTKTPVYPFTKFKVSAVVLWDCDKGETPPDPKFEVTFTPEELMSEDVLDKGDIEDVNTWFINEARLDEFVGEYLTDYTDFCHKGYTFEWEYK